MGKAITAVNSPNKTSNFYPADDKWEMIMFPIKASTAMEEGTLLSPEIVTNDVTGYLTKMGVENVVGSDFIGILAEPIVATDSDYATAGKLKGVWIPKSINASAYFTVGAGTFTASDVFRTVEAHSDSKSLAVDTKGKGARIVEFISSTRGRCTFSLPQTETA
jgi:hypothetical protein